jgi:hypothetical protein
MVFVDFANAICGFLDFLGISLHSAPRPALYCLDQTKPPPAPDTQDTVMSSWLGAGRPIDLKCLTQPGPEPFLT